MSVIPGRSKKLAWNAAGSLDHLFGGTLHAARREKAAVDIRLNTRGRLYIVYGRIVDRTRKSEYV